MQFCVFVKWLAHSMSSFRSMSSMLFLLFPFFVVVVVFFYFVFFFSVRARTCASRDVKLYVYDVERWTQYFICKQLANDNE